MDAVDTRTPEELMNEDLILKNFEDVKKLVHPYTSSINNFKISSIKNTLNLIGEVEGKAINFSLPLDKIIDLIRRSDVKEEKKT